VEAFSSQRDEARALRSLDRLIKDQQRAEPSLSADATLLAIENGATDASASQFYTGNPSGSLETTKVSPDANGGFPDAARASPLDSYDDGRGGFAQRAYDPEEPIPVEPALAVPPGGSLRVIDRLLPLWQRFVGHDALAGERLRASPLTRTLVVTAAVVGLVLLVSQRGSLFQLFERPSVSTTAALPAQTSEPTATSTSVPVAPPPHKEEPAQTDAARLRYLRHQQRRAL